MVEEARLITAAAQGDRDAFETLVQSRQEKVFWTAYQVVRNAEDARDVAQHVFIRLWQVLPRYRQSWSFDTWLYRITVNLAIDACRRRRSRPETDVDAQPLDRFSGSAQESPALQAREAEVRRIFIRLSRRLSPQQRAVFVLKEMNGLETAEIAQVMKLSPSTVRNHLHQARRELRRGLAREYPEYLPRGRRSGGDR